MSKNFPTIFANQIISQKWFSSELQSFFKFKLAALQLVFCSAIKISSILGAISEKIRIVRNSETLCWRFFLFTFLIFAVTKFQRYRVEIYINASAQASIRVSRSFKTFGCSVGVPRVIKSQIDCETCQSSKKIADELTTTERGEFIIRCK